MVSRRRRVKRVQKRSDTFNIPDELVLQIVSRVPVKDALRCRHVCRRWRDLISTQEFLDLHNRRQVVGIVPLILVEMCEYGKGMKHYLLDKWSESAPTISRLQNFHMFSEYSVEVSGDGLIVLKQLGNCIILNPTNGENVKIRLSKEIRQSKIIGVFFHPLLKEYCTIWLVTTFQKQLAPNEDRIRQEFKLLNLGPNPSWRNIKGNCPVGPLVEHMIFVDNYLYWVISDYQDMSVNRIAKIMEFDVNSEELTLITTRLEENGIHIVKKLLNHGGFLSMVEIYPYEQQLVACISTLTNRSLQLWTKTRYWFNIALCWSMPLSLDPLSLFYLEPVAITDKRLVFFSGNRFFVCNLELATMEQFGRKFSGSVKVFSHVMTVASLKGCKSEFCMGYNGEEKFYVQWFRELRKQMLGQTQSD